MNDWQIWQSVFVMNMAVMAVVVRYYVLLDFHNNLLCIKVVIFLRTRYLWFNRAP